MSVVDLVLQHTGVEVKCLKIYHVGLNGISGHQRTETQTS